MPRNRVDALEKFLVRTTHYMDAESPEEAEQLCRDGTVAYDFHQIEESAPEDEWFDTLAVEIDEPLRFFGSEQDESGQLR